MRLEAERKRRREERGKRGGNGGREGGGSQQRSSAIFNKLFYVVFISNGRTGKCLWSNDKLLVPLHPNKKCIINISMTMIIIIIVLITVFGRSFTEIPSYYYYCYCLSLLSSPYSLVSPSYHYQQCNSSLVQDNNLKGISTISAVLLLCFREKLMLLSYFSNGAHFLRYHRCRSGPYSYFTLISMSFLSLPPSLPPPSPHLPFFLALSSAFPLSPSPLPLPSLPLLIPRLPAFSLYPVMLLLSTLRLLPQLLLLL